MLRVLQAIDRANGFAYSGIESDQTLLSFMRSSVAAEFEYDKIGSIQEKYVSSDTEPVADADIG